jgi:hypothetical protein
VEVVALEDGDDAHAAPGRRRALLSADQLAEADAPWGWPHGAAPCEHARGRRQRWGGG